MHTMNNIKYPLIVLILISFLSINGWLVYSNTNSEDIDKELSIVSLAKLSDLKAGEPLRVVGVVRSNYISKEGILSVALHDGIGEIKISMFPSYGKLDHELKIGDKVQVQGVLLKYKEQYQIQPFSKNSIKLLERDSNNIQLPNVSLNEVEEYINEKILVRAVKAEDVQLFTSKAGKNHVRFRLNQEQSHVEAVMFESTWSKEDVTILKNVQSIDLIATVSMYKDELSLNVHEVFQAKEGIDTSNRSQSEESNKENSTVLLSRAGQYEGETILIGPVYFSDLEKFTSKNGKEHLRFKVMQNQSIVNAIMFEGDWSKRETTMIKSSHEYYIDAKVDEYNGAISLIVEKIKE
ncbi:MULTISPECIES: OB-fold nucleic acid binding domain-containing protein [Exiguobacterium]|uniref:OB-fold nucleic acid binding domain-containing protein n=1 Tax=Exiguobacterium TaxID=33986 RepID=UPI0007377544|nr:OB-fold nucleic acid binding domain-containing protein [Exiguobacterium chiriqhucha]